MTLPDDVIGEMRKFPFDDDTADAFLSGRVHPDDAPAGFQGVAMLVHAAMAPASPGDLDDESQLIAACSAVIRDNRGVSSATRRRHSMLASVMTIKAVAIAAAVVLGGGVAAAATGSLPVSFQASVSKDLSHVGISVPNPHGHAKTHATPAKGDGGGQASALSATSPDAYGLCTAYDASLKGTSTNSDSTGEQADSTAFGRLAAAAKAHGETVTQFCATVTRPSSVTTGRPSSVTTGPPSGSASGHSNGSADGLHAGTGASSH